MKKTRTRFAPSPTGFLHIGNLRTALFSYLIAKSSNGDCILRIEDTDKARQVEGAIEKLLDILDWAGIDFDEGPHAGGPYAPYTQSERKEIYHTYAKELIGKDGAYHCFCTSERLEELRKKQAADKVPPMYDRACRDLAKNIVNKNIEQGLPYVIRQRMPLEGTISVDDALRGTIKFPASQLDDHVLVKSDGMPTYHFASVVDDHLMRISHVVRGDEWLPSFPKNILLYGSFGWDPPIFVHMPLILNKGGGKLSKRQGDVAVEDYRLKGYLPEAILNFCVLMGWHPKDDREILEIDEVISLFKIADMGRSPAVFDPDKLDYINGYYIRKLKPDVLMALARPFLEKLAVRAPYDFMKSDDYATKVIMIERDRMKKLSDIASLTDFFFNDFPAFDPELLSWKSLPLTETTAKLREVLEVLDGIDNGSWTLSELEKRIMGHISREGGKNGEYLWPMRVALTGKKASPGPFEVAAIIGKELTVKRLENAVQRACTN